MTVRSSVAAGLALIPVFLAGLALGGRVGGEGHETPRGRAVETLGEATPARRAEIVAALKARVDAAVASLFQVVLDPTRAAFDRADATKRIRDLMPSSLIREFCAANIGVTFELAFSDGPADDAMQRPCVWLLAADRRQTLTAFMSRAEAAHLPESELDAWADAIAYSYASGEAELAVEARIRSTFGARGAPVPDVVREVLARLKKR